VSEVATGQESITEGSLPAEDLSRVFLPHTATVCYCVSVHLNITNVYVFCALVFVADLPWYIECRVNTVWSLEKAGKLKIWFLPAKYQPIYK